MTALKYDEGYGLGGNESLQKIIELLPENQRKEYIKELKEEDSTAYSEYEEWVKSMESISDKEMAEIDDLANSLE